MESIVRDFLMSQQMKKRDAEFLIITLVAINVLGAMSATFLALRVVISMLFS